MRLAIVFVFICFIGISIAGSCLDDLCSIEYGSFVDPVINYHIGVESIDDAGEEISLIVHSFVGGSYDTYETGYLLEGESYLDDKVNITIKSISSSSQSFFYFNTLDGYIENDPLVCEDTDGGRDYYEFGIATGKICESCLFVAFANEDICSDGKKQTKLLGTLYENYCNDEGFYDSEEYVCPNGCADGACLEEGRDCEDTDGGLNYLVKGKITIEGSEGYTYDRCAIKDGEEYLAPASKCEGDVCYLEEFACNLESSGDSFFGEYYACFGGCVDGVCLDAEEFQELEDVLESEEAEEDIIELENVSVNVSGSDSQVEEDVLVLAEEDYTSDNVSEKDDFAYRCDGCEAGGKCYDIGYRKNGKYCADSGDVVAQLDGESFCDNNFECKSNLCIDGECVSQGFFRKIMNWFKNFFG